MDTRITSRSSGILAHITSLPSQFGIGDIGPSSYQFIDFLVDCDQTYWQFLPLGPTHQPFGYSPYMSSSTFAGSFLILSPELLYKAGLIEKLSLENHPDFSPYVTDFLQVERYKKKLLKEAFSRFVPEKFPQYKDFLLNQNWLDDYAVFMTAKDLYQDAGWFSWPRDLAIHSKTAVQHFKQKHAKSIDYFRFEQFEFFRQWQLLREYAKEKEIQLFGDLPIYVSYDSVDVWSNQQIFTIDQKTFQPTYVAGVPPDYLSNTGQKWGNPLYEWSNSNKEVQVNLIEWWTARLAHLFTMVDIARIDHFRGFESYWAIPEGCKTAVEGKWKKGPGRSFFTQIFDTLGPLNIVAEDLGIITPKVEELRNELGFPGMKVLQFAFDDNPDNSFLPHNFTSTKCIVYTGTHDNDTSLGWFLGDRLTDRQREDIKLVANCGSTDAGAIHHALIYLAQSSISILSIIPLQDVLGFGGDCRMNTPGTATGNWKWRCAQEFLCTERANEMRSSTKRFNRSRKKT